MNKFMQFLGIIAAVVVVTVLRGYVLSILWGWFIVTHFGLPVLTIPVALGIGVTASLLAGATHQNEGKGVAAIMLSAFTYPLVALGIGWLITLFM